MAGRVWLIAPLEIPERDHGLASTPSVFTGMATCLLRNIPKVDKVLEWPGIKILIEASPRSMIVSAVREALDQICTDPLDGRATKELLCALSLTRNLDRPNVGISGF